MSTINTSYAAASSTAISSAAQSTTQRSASASAPPPPPQGGESPGDRLVSQLAADGIDEETALSIKSEIESLFTEAQANGERGPSDAFKDSVDAIFEKHGLDSDEYLPGPGGRGQGGPGGPGGLGGPPPAGGPGRPSTESTTETEASSEEDDLLAIIEKLADTESDPATIASLAVDAFYGFDTNA